MAILSSAGLQQTRVGVLLVGAAMMDDVVGLVMVNIVTTLGSGGIGGWPIARPIIASFGLLLVTLPLCAYVLKPVWRWVTSILKEESQSIPKTRKSDYRATLSRLISKIQHLSFILSISVLIIFVAIASFIDASVLFAAFIAGGVVSFLWGAQQDQQQNESLPRVEPSKMCENYYKPAMNFILVPFFFVSGTIS